VTARRLTVAVRLPLDSAAALDAAEAELRRAGVPVERLLDRLLCEWGTVDWASGRVRGEIHAIADGDITALELELSGWDTLLTDVGGEDEREVAAWVSSRVFAAAVRAASPDEVARWLADRLARQPEGPRAREVYASVREHQAGFDAILAALTPGPRDVFLDVGCGGGVLLAQALARGCRAAGADHSREMVDLSAEQNAAAVAAGDLQLVVADATALPFADDSFTCAAMAHMFFFLRDPVAALRELRRVVSSGGRIAVVTLAPEMKGHPYAAPEPLASEGFFWTDSELARLADEAGFAAVRVSRRNGSQLLEGRVP
jgi:SAM-dependent methyltransferase